MSAILLPFLVKLLAPASLSRDMPTQLYVPTFTLVSDWHSTLRLLTSSKWLYDGLNHALGSTTEETILPLDKDSVEGRFGEFREAIEKRINHLPQMLNQVSDELANNIEEITKDMLGIFVDLDDEFYSTIPTMEHQQLQELVVPQNLPATVFALAQHDPIFRDRLRNVVTKDVCAQDFLDKLDQKRRRILQAYDQYVAHGPQLRPRFVNECAVSLRHIITEISAYRESDRAPLSSKFDTMSAELALRMLEDVCDRNLDIYEHSTWQTSEDDPEEDRDCNLFANLISDPAPRYRDNFFVLDLFTEQLPVPAWLDLLGELERLMVRFTEQDAGTEFTKRMQDLIAQSQASEQLYEEAEEAQSPTSPADQWRHTQEPAGSSAGVLRGHHRRPTIDDKRSPRRRRLE